MIELLLGLIAVAAYYIGRWEGWKMHCPECLCDDDDGDDLPTCPLDPRSLIEVTR